MSIPNPTLELKSCSQKLGVPLGSPYDKVDPAFWLLFMRISNSEYFTATFPPASLVDFAAWASDLFPSRQSCSSQASSANDQAPLATMFWIAACSRVEYAIKS